MDIVETNNNKMEVGGTNPPFAQAKFTLHEVQNLIVDNSTTSATFLPPELENIPQALRELSQWVFWFAVPDPKTGKPDKVPGNAKTGGSGSSTNPDTWASFDEAAAFYQKNGGKLHTIWNKTGPVAGIGFVLTEAAQIVGIDIDHCIDTQGNISPLAQQVIERVGSYTEVSPSGTGIRIFVKGQMLTSGFKNTTKGVEVYQSGRYLTVTGRHLYEFQITDNQDAIDWLVSEYGSKASKQKPTPPVEAQTQANVDLDDVDLVEKILASKNGSRFQQLFIDGDVSDYPSQSEADLVLCNILAFWTRKNPEQMDGLFRSSALYREKWDSVRVRGQTYGEATIDKAIASTTEVYDVDDISDKVNIKIPRVANVASVAGVAEWSVPQSFTSQIEAREYPVDALPDTIRAAVKEVQAFVKAPVAMVASSALGALSLAVQAHVDVERTSNLKSPVGLFLLTIADSGERKSTCDKLFMQAIRDYEDSQRKAEKAQLRDYASRHRAWELKEQGIIDKIKQAERNGKDTGDLEVDLQELGQEEPEAPRVPKLTYSDVTAEALAFGLAKKWPSAGVISAEAGSVLGSPGMSKESVMKNLAQLNQLWDGTPLSIDRRTSESFVVSGARLTIALQIQEATLRSFFSNTGGLARGTGFMSRFLLAWPESTQGTRLFEEPPKDWPALSVFNQEIADILKEQPKIDGNGTLLPQAITLDTSAKKVWIDVFNRIESKLGRSGDLYDIKDVASKAADNAARLAAIFHVFEHGLTPVCRDCMVKAATIIFWHLNESRRFFGEIALPDTMSKMVRFDEWIIGHCKGNNNNVVSTREAQQFGPLRQKSELDATLKGLQELDRLRIRTEGKQRTIELNPMLI